MNNINRLLRSSPENYRAILGVFELRDDQLPVFLSFLSPDALRKYVYLGDVMDLLHDGPDALSDVETYSL